MSAHYKTEWETAAGGFNVGGGTKVRVISIVANPAQHIHAYSKQPIVDGPFEETIEIVAMVELSFKTTLCRSANRGCAICETPAPGPDRDGLMYLLENHDGARLAFPHDPADAYHNPERDRWPVTGWVNHAKLGLVCGECDAELRASIERVKAKRAKGRA